MSVKRPHTWGFLGVLLTRAEITLVLTFSLKGGSGRKGGFLILAPSVLRSIELIHLHSSKEVDAGSTPRLQREERLLEPSHAGVVLAAPLPGHPAGRAHLPGAEMGFLNENSGSTRTVFHGYIPSG